MSNVFKLGELFCGPGGLAYAATNAQIEDKSYSIKHVWANDYDQDTCNTYTRNASYERAEEQMTELTDFDTKKANDVTVKWG